jgi:predicted acylesterase/phospholipase RssA
LAKHFLAHPGHAAALNEQSARLILPHVGTCPSCFTRSSWGEIVRGIYARREREKEDEELAEKTRIRDMKAAEVADKKRKTEREREEKRRLVEEAREERRRLKETEKLGKTVTKRRGKAREVELSETD